MRISEPSFDEKKFKEALLYVLRKVGAYPNFGEAILYKILYFIDFNFYEKYEEHLIGCTYKKTMDGPIPCECKELVKEMVVNHDLERIDSQNFEGKNTKYLPRRREDLERFCAIEIKCIDEVLDRLCSMTPTAINEYCYKDVPWMVTAAELNMDYESVFYRTPEYSVRGDYVRMYFPYSQ